MSFNSSNQTKLLRLVSKLAGVVTRARHTPCLRLKAVVGLAELAGRASKLNIRRVKRKRRCSFCQSLNYLFRDARRELTAERRFRNTDQILVVSSMVGIRRPVRGRQKAEPHSQIGQGRRTSDMEIGFIWRNENQS